MLRFPAHRDRATVVSTVVLTALLAGVAALLLGLPADDGPVEVLLHGVAVLLLLVPLGAWLLAPVAFTIEADALVVERRLRSLRLPLASIRAVAVLPDDALSGVLRVGGSSGLFGSMGAFWSRRLGAFRLYATRRGPLVRVDAGGGRWVLSPATPERFAAALVARAPRASGAPPDEAPSPMPRSVWLPLAVAAVALPLLVGGVVGAAVAFAPRDAAVGATAVMVERRLAGPIEVPLDSIGEARLVRPEEWRGLRRTAGTSLGDVAYGRFWTPALGTFQLYAWRRGGGVLLETPGGRLVITPDAPERFLADLAARRGR